METDTQAGIACGCVPPFLVVAVGHALAREEPVVPVLFSAGFWARDYAHPRCPGCGPLIAEIETVANRTLRSAVSVGTPDDTNTGVHPPAGPA